MEARPSSIERRVVLSLDLPFEELRDDCLAWKRV